ncbi:MAG: UDP-N-acetylmuramate dehydrogenase [Halanaerobiales bacterium]|nr:UDP-N-acetylmuramate dehydrogenase [Halanaerobiales bacterium]
MKKIINKLKNIDNLDVEKDVPLKNYTTFKVGGPADLFLTPKDENALLELTKIIQDVETPHFILGAGSNVIVGDKGYRGIIIYTGELNKIFVNENNIKAQSGATLKNVTKKAQENSLTGMEFACGIPGSLGGAVFMNAGAYGGEMNDIIVNVSAVNNNGKKIILNKDELKLSYRNSVFQEKNYIILDATMKLSHGDKDQIKDKMEVLTQKRQNKQPLEYPSAGSSFKRPEDHYTGPLIEKANMKGYQIGGAQVSEKHAGFIINKGDATAKDILNLIKKIQEEVYKISGVKLKPEPKFLGEF